MTITQRQSKKKLSRNIWLITKVKPMCTYTEDSERPIFYFEGKRLKFPFLNKHCCFEQTAKKWEKIRKKSLNPSIPMWLVCISPLLQNQRAIQLFYISFKEDLGLGISPQYF